METIIADKKRYGTIESFNAQNSKSWDKRYVFVLNHQNNKPALENITFPNSFSLKLEDQIFDAVKKKMRIIRVVEGEQSIFKDEQSEEGQKRDAVRKVFSKRGDLIVEERENFTLEFLMKCNFNGTNTSRDITKKPLFYMLELGKGLKVQLEQDKAETEAKNWCYTSDYKHITRYARVLGLDIERDPDEVRFSLLNLAKSDPKKFVVGLNNENTKRKFYVLEAIDRGILLVNSQQNTLSWKTGHMIISAPIGMNPIDFFVDMSISDSNYGNVYQTVKGHVEPEGGTQATTGKPDDKINQDAIESLVAGAINKGIVTQTTGWYIFGEKKWKGKKTLIEALNGDSITRAAIEEAVYGAK